MIATQLATILNILNPAATTEPIPAHGSPPRITKRKTPSTPDGSAKTLEYFQTQESIITSATSDPNEGMEGCED